MTFSLLGRDPARHGRHRHVVVEPRRRRPLRARARRRRRGRLPERDRSAPWPAAARPDGGGLGAEEAIEESWQPPDIGHRQLTAVDRQGRTAPVGLPHPRPLRDRPRHRRRRRRQPARDRGGARRRCWSLRRRRLARSATGCSRRCGRAGGRRRGRPGALGRPGDLRCRGLAAADLRSTGRGTGRGLAAIWEVWQPQPTATCSARSTREAAPSFGVPGDDLMRFSFRQLEYFVAAGSRQRHPRGPGVTQLAADRVGRDRQARAHAGGAAVRAPPCPGAVADARGPPLSG